MKRMKRTCKVVKNCGDKKKNAKADVGGNKRKSAKKCTSMSVSQCGEMRKEIQTAQNAP